MTQLLQDHPRCSELIDIYGSPVNVLHPHVLPRNAAELVEAGRAHGVDVRVFFARKANKGLCFVDAAAAARHGIDVASRRELQQVLGRGVEPHRVILSAAVKPQDLLELAVDAGVLISVDTVAEMSRIQAIAEKSGRPARVVPRIAPDPELLPPTRFGELANVWVKNLPPAGGPVQLVGVHMHLHGYSEADRRVALADALTVVDAANAAGHSVEFVDMGGGVPMSYLDSAEEWEAFHVKPRDTWKDDPLHNLYPFHQAPVRGGWLGEFLSGEVRGCGEDSAHTSTVAEALQRRNLRLHMEPGRSILDGGGVILARVAFVKKRSDGENLIGLEMNRTQCRTTSDDIGLDPILVRSRATAGAPEEGEGGEARGGVAAMNGFLVGAYCIEDEVLVRRRREFPHGVRPGDIVAIPNTAGYFMHILESASHQIPLARNVWVDEAGAIHPDDIDGLPAR